MTPERWQQISGGVPIQLTRDDVDEREPAFSPDGSRIAFTAGGTPREIGGMTGVRYPVWSPDAFKSCL